jgi:hypothetical protein
LARRPPSVESRAYRRVAKHAFVEANLHEEIHRLTDCWSGADAKVLHHRETIKFGA